MFICLNSEYGFGIQSDASPRNNEDDDSDARDGRPRPAGWSSSPSFSSASASARSIDRSPRSGRATDGRTDGNPTEERRTIPMTDDAGAPVKRTLPKLTFTLKRPAAVPTTSGRDAANGGDVSISGGGKKRSREEYGGEEERRIRELRRKMAELSEMLPEGEMDAVETAPTLSGVPRALQRVMSGAPSGLARGTAPRAAIFGMGLAANGSGEAREGKPGRVEEEAEEEDAEPTEPQVGGQNVSLDPPRMKNEAPVSKKKLDDAIGKLQKLDKTYIFAMPVTEDIAPGYFSVVTHPMDFSTLRAKVKNNDYPHFHPFCVDVETMYRNALQYNPPATEIHQIAAKMLMQARRILNKLRGLPINAGFIKPKKVKVKPVKPPKPPPQPKKTPAPKPARTSAPTGAISTMAHADMFAAIPVPTFDDDSVVDDLSLAADHFDIGFDSFLDDSFPMMDMQDEIEDALRIDDSLMDDEVVLVTPPQEMVTKTLTTTKRQTFRMARRPRSLMRLPEMFAEVNTYKQKLVSEGNVVIPYESNSTLDIYYTSVRSFFSPILSDEKAKALLTQKWSERATLPDVNMVPAPKITTPLPAPPPTTMPPAAQRPPQTSQPKASFPSSSAAASQPVKYDYSNMTLATLLRQCPSDPTHPARIKAGLAGMRAMQRSGEVLRGLVEPPNENPLDRLPAGFIPENRSMVFVVSVIGNTISHCMRRAGVEQPGATKEEEEEDADNKPTLDEDDIPLSMLGS